MASFPTDERVQEKSPSPATLVRRFMIDGGVVLQVKISPKFQVVIPKLIRESMRGFLAGMSTDLQRVPDCEF